MSEAGEIEVGYDRLHATDCENDKPKRFASQGRLRKHKRVKTVM